jgi:hypothetical protein
MGWFDIIAPIAAGAAIVASGGTAAPAVAGMEGALGGGLAAGEGLAAGTTALGAEAAGGAAGMGGASGAGVTGGLDTFGSFAGGAAGPSGGGAAGATGAVAPTGEAAITTPLQNMAGMPPGGAPPGGIPPGGVPDPTMPGINPNQGIQTPGLQNTAQGTVPQVAQGLPQSPAQQMAQTLQNASRVKNGIDMMTGQPAPQQAPGAPSGAPTPPPAHVMQGLNMAQANPLAGNRQSLAELLYGRG